MGLLAAIIWIVVGIVYVIYKGFKEEREATVTIFIWYLKYIGFLGFGVGSTVLVFYLSAKDVNSILPYVLATATYLIYFGAAFYFIFRHDKGASSALAEKQKKKRLLYEEYKKLGIEVSGEMISCLIDNPTSPAYDTDVSLQKCYAWMCAKKENEINSMITIDFDKALGVDLESIPINDSIPEWLAIEQRKALAAKSILESEGLDVVDGGTNSYWIKKARLMSSSETSLRYEENFKNYIPDRQCAKQDGKNPFLNKGNVDLNREYELSQMNKADLGKELGFSLSDFTSDTRIYDGDFSKLKPIIIKYILEQEGVTPDNTGELYWTVSPINFNDLVTSYKRECQLKNMDEKDFKDILGISLNDLPMNNNIELWIAEKQRKALAIKYILDREGLSCSPHGFCAQWINRADDGSLYPQILKRHIEKLQN